MKKNKFIFLIVGVMLVAFAFAACDSGSSTTYYTVTFALGDGTGTIVTTQSVQAGAKASNPGDPVRTDGDWFFLGWHYEDQGDDYKWNFNVNTVDYNITLTGEWTLDACHVNFESYDGSAVAQITVGLGGTIEEPPEPVLAKYGFEGWFLDEDFNNKWDFEEYEVEVTSLTLYAKWGGPYALGDTGPGGGRIAYYNDTGFDVQGYGEEEDDTGYFAPYTAYYLEVAPANASTSAYWAGSRVLVPNVSSVDSGTGTAAPPAAITATLGSGRKDTQAIITWLLTSEASTAANRAASLAANYSGGGKGDWFLPSIGEFYQLYTGGYSGLTGTTYYWSSTEYTYYYGFRFRFSDGTRNNQNKQSNQYVRAIRAF